MMEQDRGMHPGVCINMYMSIIFPSPLMSRVTCSARLPRVFRKPAKQTRKMTLVLRGQSGVSSIEKCVCILLPSKS